MVIHVGVRPDWGKLSYYNEAEKRTIENQINSVKENKENRIHLMYEEIKSIINGKYLGCACICLYEWYDNEIRKKFIEEGLKAGFKNVEIINWKTALYLNAMSQINYKPLNGNVIWIDCVDNFCVWKITNYKAKFIGAWNGNASKLSDLEKIVNDSKLKKGPDIVLYYYKIDEKKFSKISKKCLFFNYNVDSINNGIIMKARIMAGDKSVDYLDAENFLSQNITLNLKEKEILSFKIGQQLPIVEYQKILKTHSDLLHIISNSKTMELLKLPNYEIIFLTFKIDTNEIYSVSFTGTKTEHDSDNEVFEASSNKINDLFKKLFLNSISYSDGFAIPKITSFYDATKNAVGIDFGMTKCCAAVIRKNGITTVPLDYHGERFLPSYIAYDEVQAKFGQIVVNRLRHYSKSTVYDLKRIIGKNFIAVDRTWPFKVIITKNKVTIKIETLHAENERTATEITADLLKYMKIRLEEFQGSPLSKVVITVPTTFTIAQKHAIIEAAKMANWETVTLLPEPIAAAFAYFINRQILNNSILLLFDLGGGTLNICTFKIIDNHILIISNTNDSRFGGRDFDNILMDYFSNKFDTEYDISELGEKKYKLLAECQNIKHDLSVCNDARLDVQDFDVTKTGFIKITREIFYLLIEDLMNKIQNIVHSALYVSNFKADQIDKVLYVGGGSRMPVIKNLLKKMFPFAEHCIEEHPDEVVAIGAALYASSIYSKNLL